MRMIPSIAALPLAALLLTGCASYAPQPLATGPSAIQDATPDVLAARASGVERPWLTPVAIDLARPLSVDAIAALAVANNPDLAALRARHGVSGAQVFAAGLLPDPNFSVGASKVLSGPDTMLDLAGAIGFDIAALRTRSVRREQAVAQDRQVRLDLAWAEWQTAGQARIQMIRSVELMHASDLAQQSRNTASGLEQRIERAAGRGDIAGDRLQAARLAALNAQEALNSSESALATARSELRRLLGLAPGTPLRLAEPVLPPVPPPADALFSLAMENRTDLAALRAGYAAQEASVHQAVLEQFPNLALTLNTQRDSAGNLLAGPSLDFTLPLWNRNRGAIAVERATRDALKAEYHARLFQTRADIAAAEEGIALAARRRVEAEADLPRLENYATATRRAASRGDLSIETAENAEQALRDRQAQIVQARQDYAEQMVALELLTGTPMEAWPR